MVSIPRADVSPARARRALHSWSAEGFVGSKYGEGRGGEGMIFSGRGLLAGRRFGGRHLVRGVRERRFQLDVLGVGGRGLLARAALGPEAVQREVAQDHGDGGGDDDADDEADARADPPWPSQASLHAFS